MIRSLVSSKSKLASFGGLRRFSTNQSFTRSLPGEVFTDPKYYEVERKHLLGTTWQLLGHESQLNAASERAPAMYIADLVSGWPAIVVKSARNGQVNAYHNVCRHKGGPMQWHDTAGVCDLNGLKCKYHGWAYSLDGKLLGVPAFCDAKDGKLDRSEFDLWPMRVAVWRGLVFVQATPNAPGDPCAGVAMNGPDADAAFLKVNKAFCDRMDGLTGNKVPLEEFSFHSQKSHKLNCNWKVRNC
jgi:choline monooxygenase